MTEKDRPQGKLEIKLGNLSFSGEGDQSWLTTQLQKLIDSAEVLNKTVVSPVTENARQMQPPANDGVEGSLHESLATYLKAKNAERNQLMRFLATADWLRRHGEKSLTTGLIARTLSEHQQSRLGNPSDCLNQNVKKGLCQKKNGGFFITPEGLKLLGH